MFLRHIFTAIGIIVKVFANGPGALGSIAMSSYTKDSKNGSCSLLAHHSEL